MPHNLQPFADKMSFFCPINLFFQGCSTVLDGKTILQVHTPDPFSEQRQDNMGSLTDWHITPRGSEEAM